MADAKQPSDITLLNRFKKSFLLHSSRYNLYSDETIEKGATARHNKAVTDLGKLEDKVIENPSLYSDLILEFLEGDDQKASLCAGFTCLWANIHTEKAIEKLTYIAKNTSGISMIASFDIAGSIGKFQKKQMEAKPRNEIDALAEKMKPTENGGEGRSDEELLEIINNLTDINKCGCDDKTPLMYACMYDRVVLVGRLLELGADVNKKDCYRNGSAIHLAAMRGNIETITLLLDNGADVNDEYKGGYRAWDFAKGNHAGLTIDEKEKLLKFLLSRGADPRNNVYDFIK